jgi:hypothetical protein
MLRHGQLTRRGLAAWLQRAPAADGAAAHDGDWDRAASHAAAGTSGGSGGVHLTGFHSSCRSHDSDQAAAAAGAMLLRQFIHHSLYHPVSEWAAMSTVASLPRSALTMPPPPQQLPAASTSPPATHPRLRMPARLQVQGYFSRPSPPVGRLPDPINFKRLVGQGEYRTLLDRLYRELQVRVKTRAGWPALATRSQLPLPPVREHEPPRPTPAPARARAPVAAARHITHPEQPAAQAASTAPTPLMQPATTPCNMHLLYGGATGACMAPTCPTPPHKTTPQHHAAAPPLATHQPPQVDWLTPVEIFRPWYGAALAHYMLELRQHGGLSAAAAPSAAAQAAAAGVLDAAGCAAADPLAIIEIGGGTGTLAASILVGVLVTAPVWRAAQRWSCTLHGSNQV